MRYGKSMKFDLILGDNTSKHTVLKCDIFQHEYLDIFQNEPTMCEWNLYNDKSAQLQKLSNELKKLIDTWNTYGIHQLDTSEFYLFGDDSAAASMKLHQDILNPLQSSIITAYRDLNDNSQVEHTEELVVMFRKLNLIRDIVSHLSVELDSQQFQLAFERDYKLFEDDDFARFSFARNPGEIFLAPTDISYNYDNLIIEEKSAYEIDMQAIRMTPGGTDLIGQQIYYGGNLIFWCGASRTHEETVNQINYSLEKAWGGYTLNAQDLRNKWNMLTTGMIKVGSFNKVPDLEFNEVIGYVIQ